MGLRGALKSVLGWVAGRLGPSHPIELTPSELGSYGSAHSSPVGTPYSGSPDVAGGSHSRYFTPASEGPGDGGTALHGKHLLWAVTTGGGESHFEIGAHPGFDVLSQPLQATAIYCGLNWLPPFAAQVLNNSWQVAVFGRFSASAFALCSARLRSFWCRAILKPGLKVRLIIRSP